MNSSERPSRSPKEFDFTHENGHHDVPLEKDPSAVVFKGPGRPDSKSKAHESSEKKNMHESTPSPIDARKTIERQAREQKFFSTVLNSAATAMLVAILTIGVLAALGGFVLWKQIENQSVTISLLDANLRKEIARANDEREKAEARLNHQLETTMVQTTALRTQVDTQAASIRELSSLLDSERTKNRQRDVRLMQMDHMSQRMNDLERLSSRNHQ